MSVYSLFFSAALAAYDSDVDDADYAASSTRFVHGQRYNILYRKIEDIYVDESTTRVLSFANYASTEWLYLVLEVVGWAQVELVGKDFNGSSDINGYIPTYGTSLFPGKLLISTYNVTTATIRGLQDGTKIRLLGAIACPDNDARYSENA